MGDQKQELTRQIIIIICLRNSKRNFSVGDIINIKDQEIIIRPKRLKEVKAKFLRKDIIEKGFNKKSKGITLQLKGLYFKRKKL